MHNEYVSFKKQLVLSGIKRQIQSPDDLEEFYLLNVMRDMIEKEIAITFKSVNCAKFKSDDMHKLQEFCNQNENNYRIKMKEVYHMMHTGTSKGAIIDIDVGLWDNKVHDDDERLFNCWNSDCHYC